MGLLTRLWNLIRQLVGLVLPLFSSARDFAALGPTARAVLHLLLVAAVLGLLYWLNYYFKIDVLVGYAPPPIPQFYLPLLFLIVYFLSWLGWWLWQLLWTEDEDASFPDIDAAWAEAVAELNAQGIDVRDAPLFLLLGRPGGGEAPLFQAAQLQFAVQQAPRRPDSPLHVWANADGIYVTCAGASLTGRFTDLLLGHGKSNSSVPLPDFVEGEFDPYKTLPPQGRLREVQTILAKAHAEGRRPDQLTPEEREEIRRLVSEDESWAPQAGAKPRTSLTKNHDEVEQYIARFTYLCRLISRDRRPFCPINGIMLLLPLPALTDDEEASQAASVLQYDLAAARKGLQMIFPIFTVVSDLESAPGFSEFLARFPGEQRFGRLGQRFPLMSELEGSALTAQVEALAYWVCRGLLGTHVYKLFQAETLTAPDAAAAVRGNAQLYQFMVHLRKASRNLARVLTRGLLAEPADTVRYGGCYLAGTGLDARSQGFIAGVFRRLKQCENAVSWSPEAIAEEAENQRWTQFGYIALGLFVLAIVGAGAARLFLY